MRSPAYCSTNFCIFEGRIHTDPVKSVKQTKTKEIDRLDFDITICSDTFYATRAYRIHLFAEKDLANRMAFVKKGDQIFAICTVHTNREQVSFEIVKLQQVLPGIQTQQIFETSEEE